MIRPLLRLGLCALLLASSLAQAQVADDERPFREPVTAAEFFNAINYEIDVGKPELAAKYLRGLVNRKPVDKELVDLLDKEGYTALLRLRNVPVWSGNAKIQEQAKKDVADLIQMATDANKRRLADPARMGELIALLRATPEENTYAIQELIKSGPQAIPFLVDAYLNSKDSEARLAIRQALEKLGLNTVPPLLAALDMEPGPTANTLLKLDILELLRTKHARAYKDIVPFLWYPAAARDESPEVRKKATQVLSEFTGIAPTRLPSSKVALTAEAEKYYQGKVTFPDPKAVPIWRWDGKRLVEGWPGVAAISTSQAEEYYGMKLARQALALDPEYRPAQLVGLSLAVDKGMQKAGPAAPLSRTSPQVAEVLAKASPELLIEMLERGMKEKRHGVVLATVRALGERAEMRAKRPTTLGEPALVQALYYPDQRVQVAAARALLRIPGSPAPKTTSRIVDILMRGLSPAAAYNPGSRILVALADEDSRLSARKAVVEAGYVPELARNTREVMRAIRNSSEVTAILLDSTLPGSGLANTLANLRADVNVSSVPVLLVAVPESPAAHNAVDRYRTIKTRIDAINQGTVGYRSRLAQINDNERLELKDMEAEFVRDRRPGAASTVDADRIDSLRIIERKYRVQREELDKAMPTAVKVLRDMPYYQSQLDHEIQRYDLEARLRENALTRYVASYPTIKVVHPSTLLDGKDLARSLLAQGGPAPITGAEQKELADQCLELLAGLAEGKPAGYDIRPAVPTMMEALRTGRVGPEAQLAAVRAAAILENKLAQEALAVAIRENGRSPGVRLLAAKSLAENVQRFGKKLTREDYDSFDRLAKDPATDAKLRDQLNYLAGSLHRSERSTGNALQGYRPTPAAPLAPPKE